MIFLRIFYIRIIVSSFRYTTQLHGKVQEIINKLSLIWHKSIRVRHPVRIKLMTVITHSNVSADPQCYNYTILKVFLNSNYVLKWTWTIRQSYKEIARSITLAIQFLRKYLLTKYYKKQFFTWLHHEQFILLDSSSL